ncbi:PlsC 1-acyl-sn-glycerol-3-phosphate acyltransferase [Rhabdaerophilaceae bacterium]
MSLTFRQKLKIAGKLAAMVPAFAVGLPAQWLALRFSPSLSRRLPLIFHRYLAYVIGVRILREGHLAQGPVMLVSNHVSWLDIVVLSACHPVSFIAKSEVGTWPFVRTLARLQRSVFVERDRRAKTGAVNAEIAGRLEKGDAMVLFAEGTTSDGLRVLPFRSAILGAAQGGEMQLQPLAIRYIKRAGLPIGRAEMPEIAWYGDMDLGPHLAELLAGPPIIVKVCLGSAQPVERDRKAQARSLETSVRVAFEAAARAR